MVDGDGEEGSNSRKQSQKCDNFTSAILSAFGKAIESVGGPSAATVAKRLTIAGRRVKSKPLQCACTRSYPDGLTTNRGCQKK